MFQRWELENLNSCSWNRKEKPALQNAERACLVSEIEVNAAVEFLHLVLADGAQLLNFMRGMHVF